MKIFNDRRRKDKEEDPSMFFSGSMKYHGQKHMECSETLFIVLRNMTSLTVSVDEYTE